MAKVEFFCDSGANIHSCRRSKLDTVTDLGLDEGEWEEMDEDSRDEIVKDWMNDHLEYGYKTLD